MVYDFSLFGLLLGLQDALAEVSELLLSICVGGVDKAREVEGACVELAVVVEGGDDGTGAGGSRESVEGGFTSSWSSFACLWM